MFRHVYFLIISIMLACTSCMFVRDDQNVFRVGMMSGWPPFMNIDKYGKYYGYDVDVAQYIADRLGKKLIIEDLGSLEGLVLGLLTKKVSCIMSGLDITQERKKLFYMVSYTTKVIDRFYLLSLKKPIIRSLDDLSSSDINTLSIVAEPGSPSYYFLEKYYSKYITIRPVSRVSDMMLELRYNKADMVILEPSAADYACQYYIPPYQIITKLEVILPQEYILDGLGIGINLSNHDMYLSIKDIIHGMRHNGILKNLEDKWGIS